MTGATKYRVYRSEYVGGAWSDWASVCAGTTATSWNDTAVTPGLKYKYRVRATVNGAWGEYSNEVTLTAAGTVTVPILTVSAQSGKIAMSWNKVTGATKYRVYRSEYVGGSWTDWASVCASTTGTAWTDTSVTAGVKYRYRIRGYVGSDWGEYSGEVTVTAK